VNDNKVNRNWQILMIIIWIFSLGVAYATITSRVSNNEIAIIKLINDIDENSYSVEAIKDDRGSLSNDMIEIKFNMKSICKALNIDYISTNDD